MRVRIVSLFLLLIFAVPISSGCSTISRGFNNLLGNEVATSDAQSTRQYDGNSGTQTTIPAEQEEHEQAIAFGLSMQTESYRFSIKKNDTDRMDRKLVGLLNACDEALERIKTFENTDTLRSREIRSAIALIKQAGPVRDDEGLKLATQYLQSVRGG